MKIAVIGSRKITDVPIQKYVGAEVEEIVSWGAEGVDTCAAEYARANGLRLTVILPEYEKYGRAAPIVRNKQIVDHADRVVAFWDGRSKGTLSAYFSFKKEKLSKRKLYNLSHEPSLGGRCHEPCASDG